MWAFAAAEPFFSRPPLRLAPREVDLARVPLLEAETLRRVRAVARRERERAPVLRRLPSARDIIAACAPVTSPGMIKTDLSATAHSGVELPPILGSA